MGYFVNFYLMCCCLILIFQVEWVLDDELEEDEDEEDEEDVEEEGMGEFLEVGVDGQELFLFLKW